MSESIIFEEIADEQGWTYMCHDVLYGADSRDQIPGGSRPTDHPFVWHHFAHWCGTCQTSEKTCFLWETTNGCEFWFCSVGCALRSGLAFSDRVNILQEEDRP